MRICVITGNPSSHSSKRFLEEAGHAKHKLYFASWKKLVFDGKTNTLYINQKIPLDSFDAIILRSATNSVTPVSLITEYCRNKNIVLLNKHLYSRLQNANKLFQQALFQTNNIPCLETLYGENLTFSFLKKNFGVPFVAKMSNGTLGKQVFKINSPKKLAQFLKMARKNHQPCIFQKYYRVACDYRAFILGKNVFGSVQRIAPKGGWKTNIKGAEHKRASEAGVLKLTKLVGEKLNADFVGVDILIDSAGQARVIEINTMAGFKVFEKVFPEINIAQKTIRLLKKKQKRQKTLIKL